MTRQLVRTSRAAFTLLVLSFALFTSAGCGDDDDDNGGGGATPDATIRIVPNAFNQGMMAFESDTTTVAVNAVVRMRNDDSITHVIQTVTTGGPSWGSISAGGSRDATAAQAGTFTFICTVGGHTMTGVLVVTP